MTGIIPNHWSLGILAPSGPDFKNLETRMQVFHQKLLLEQ